MDIIQLGGCKRCGGDVYRDIDYSFIQRSSDGFYYGCLQCGITFHPAVTISPTIRLEDICMQIINALSKNKEGIPLQTIINSVDFEEREVTTYLRLMVESGYVSINEIIIGEKVRISAYRNNDQNRAVLSEYRDLVQRVEEERTTFKMYSLFNERLGLTRFGSFAKKAAKKEPDKYARLGQFIGDFYGVTRVKISGNKKSNGSSSETKEYGNQAQDGYQAPHGIYQDSQLTVDFDDKAVVVRANAVKLSRREFELLSILLQRPGVMVNKNDFSDLFEGINPDDALRQIIRTLRKKIEEDPKNPQLIQTVRGGEVGYIPQTSND